MISISGSRMQVKGNLTMETVTGLFLEGFNPPPGVERLEVDLSGLEKVDSSAVSMMLVWMRQARQKNISFHFINVPENLTALAKLYGVAGLLGVAAV